MKKIIIFIFLIPLIVEAQIVKDVHSVDQSSSIALMNLNEGDIVFTKIGGKYIIQSDSIANYAVDNCVTIPTLNGKYAILQPRDGGFYIEDFGAIPNDNIDDHIAIQKCIDAAIALNITSKVNAGPGTFHLDSGVVISRSFGGSYTFVTLTLSGAIPVYDHAPAPGSVTVFQSRAPTFGVAVQLGRNILIENIFFIGNAAGYDSFTKKQIIENTEEDWQDNGKARTNHLSPSCGIVIDPFHSGVGVNSRYPGQENRYFQTGQGGTSMMTIKGCGFRRHYIAIANGPSGGATGNGDNIRAENCRVINCNTFWAAGQTQSRGNSIDNIYSTVVRSFVDCALIGKRLGTPPAITNCNIAGFTKELFRSRNASFAPFRMTNSYIESLFSLGYAEGTNVSFHQCQIKFFLPIEGDGIYAPPYHLVTTQASFVDCSLEYFNSLNTKQPFVFNTHQTRISGGHVEGGVVLPYGFSNAGGDRLHNIKFDQTRIRVLGDKYAGSASFSGLQNSHKSILMGGDKLTVQNSSPGPNVFENVKSTYNLYFVGSHELHIDPTTESGYIVASDPGQFKVGDNLIHGFPSTYINPDEINMQSPNYPDPTATNYVQTKIAGAIGAVSSIDGDTVHISGIPYGLEAAMMSFYTVEYPIFFLPIWGDVTAGSNTITNVEILGNHLTSFIKPGDRIINAAFPLGAYVVSRDLGAMTIEMSTASTQTETHKFFRHAPLKQTVYSSIFTGAAPAQTTHSSPQFPYIEGCQLINDEVSPPRTVHGYITVTGGYRGGTTNVQPVFKALTH